MGDILNYSQEIEKLIEKRTKRLWRSSVFVKIALLAIASAIVAIAQFADVPEGKQLSAWGVSGIVASIVVAIGAIYITITETDSSLELAKAQKALDAARDVQVQSQYNDEIISDYEDQVDKYIHLNQSIMLMRDAIESSALFELKDEKICEILLKASSRSLKLCMDFRIDNQWAICVYKAYLNKESKFELRCVAHDREFDCDLAKARVWQKGVGIAGISFANETEVVIPDMLAAGMEAIYSGPSSANLTREHDSVRYRSMTAVPVLVQGMKHPWGVIVVSSDAPNHFNLEQDVGLKTHEGARALAKMIELCIATKQKNGFTQNGEKDEESE